MQAATFSLPIDPLLGVGAPQPDAERLAVYDDPEEWQAFSRPLGQPAQTLDDAAPPAGALWESHLVVRGMHCAACALTLEQALLGVRGVTAVRVSAASARASVCWSSALTMPSRWMAATLPLGYELVPASDAFAPDHARQEARLMLWRWLVAGFCMMQVMMYAAPAYFTVPGDISPDLEKLLRWASWVLSLPVVFFSCGPFFKNAGRDLARRSISMDLPVALGIGITFAVSTAATFDASGWWGKEVYFDSLTMFVFFLLTGRWLEQRLRERTAGSLEKLMQRLPDSVERQLVSGDFERVAVRRLKPGDVLRVRPGEAFPGDACILSGDTHVDEALLTGESRPVARRTGQQVLAGSYNVSSLVTVRVEALGGQTRYAQIVALMAQASLEKPRLAQLADRVARPFLWFVLLASAGAIAYGWRIDPAQALMAAVAVLVVTCPCALSLATPSAMLTSAGLLARHGVLVRHLQAIEALADIDTVIFDKTGTLTDPQMRLQTVQTRAGVSQRQAMQLASALAAQSLHPVSRALLAAAGDVNVQGISLTGLHEIAGQGVEACLDSACLPDGSGAEHTGLLRLGSAAFCAVPAWHVDGVQLHLSDAQGWVARFEFGEAMRSDAIQTVASLQAAGIEVHLLSGDRDATAARLAGALGIRHAEGDCTPESKLDRLRTLQQQGRKVLMVGDGLNDGPVLAGAQVSVAIGSAVPLAQARSDFVLPGGQLAMLPVMLGQARRTMRVVRQNLCWAAAYNALCVPLALAGYLPAWLAGLGMALSSLLVVANAARLSRLSHLAGALRHSGIANLQQLPKRQPHGKQR